MARVHGSAGRGYIRPVATGRLVAGIVHSTQLVTLRGESGANMHAIATLKDILRPLRQICCQTGSCRKPSDWFGTYPFWPSGQNSRSGETRRDDSAAVHISRHPACHPALARHPAPARYPAYYRCTWASLLLFRLILLVEAARVGEVGSSEAGSSGKVSLS